MSSSKTYRFDLATSPITMYEWDDGSWQAERLSLNESLVANLDGTVTLTESYETYNEVKTFAVVVGSEADPVYSKQSDTYTLPDGTPIVSPPGGNGGDSEGENEDDGEDENEDGNEGVEDDHDGDGDVDDDINGSDDDDIEHGGDGDDSIDGGNGSDELYGDAGNDDIDGGDGDDVIRGGVGFDVLLGGVGSDDISGGDDDDLIEGGDGDDTVNAGAGDDIIVGGNGAGDDRYEGGQGIDTVKYGSATAGIKVNLQTGLAASLNNNDAQIGFDILSGIENVIGGSFADTLTGNGSSNRIDGGAGADMMSGGAGNDTYIIDNLGDRITDSSGADEVQASISYTLGSSLERLVLLGAANLNGTGNAAANTLSGNAGNNLLDGGKGADLLLGAEGDDIYILDSIGDAVTEMSNGGSDLVRSSVSVSGRLADDSTTAYFGGFVENVTLTGAAAIKATGNALDNVIYGNSGANTIDGGEGLDILFGGLGRDTLIGGSGNDIFRYNSVSESGITATTRDTIADFWRGRDDIDLSAIDAMFGGTANDAFTWLGNIAAPTTANANGALWFTGGVLYGSNDADVAAEFSIALTGISVLNINDFIL